MIRHQIERRPDWRERVAECGVDPGNAPISWCEDVCYEISVAEAEEIHQLTSGIYHLMADATDQLIDQQLIVDLCDDPALIQPLIASWNDADYFPTLLTRFDFELKQDSAPQLVHMSLHSPSLLLQSSVAQWRWARERVPWATQYNQIEERLLSLWREYRYTGKLVHFSYPENNYEIFLTAEYLCELALEAGVDARLVSTAQLRYDSAEDRFYDHLQQPVQRLVRSGHEGTLGGLSIAQAHRVDSLCIAEPLWKDIWAHPHWTSWLKEVRCADPLCKHLQISPPQDPALICSSWIIAGEPCGIGISEWKNERTRLFIPHLLDREPVQVAPVMQVGSNSSERGISAVPIE